MPLYWRAVGTGPVIACCNGVGVSTFFWKHLVAAFSSTHTVVVWDYCGHGRSGRAIDWRRTDLSVARHARDLATVLAIAAPDGGPAIVVGHSMGCQVALEACRQSPEAVRALILVLGTAGGALATFFDNPRMPAYFAVFHRIARHAGPLPMALARPALASPLAWPVTRGLRLVDPNLAPREDIRAYIDHIATLDLPVFLQCVAEAQRHDAWDLLPTLGCPVLIIAAERDSFTPLWCSRRMAEQVPGAELLVLQGASHAALIEQPERINERVERFLRERVAHTPA